MMQEDFIQYLDKEAMDQHLGVKLLKRKEYKYGTLYEYGIEDKKFGMIIHSTDGKVTFYLFDLPSEDEMNFWSKYYVRVFNDYDKQNHVLSMLRIKQYMEEIPVRIIMDRTIPTMFVFKRDFKYMLKMALGWGAYQ